MWTVDYGYYTGVFLGAVVSEVDWPRAIREACAYIDGITYGRLRGAEKIPEEAMLAACAVAETADAHRSALAKHGAAAGVKSFSNDGYTETLADAVQLAEDYARQKADAAAVYLPRAHPLRYAGVC